MRLIIIQLMIFLQIDEVKLLVLFVLALLTIRKARQLRRSQPPPLNYEVLHEIVQPKQNLIIETMTSKRINGREEYWKKYGNINGRKLIKSQEEININDDHQKQDKYERPAQQRLGLNVRQIVIEQVPILKMPQFSTILSPTTSSRSTIPSQSEQSLGIQLLHFSEKSDDNDIEEISQQKINKKQQKQPRKIIRIHKKCGRCGMKQGQLQIELRQSQSQIEDQE